MLLTAKQLLALTVRTRSGSVLGRVSEIEYDTDSQQVLRYRVTAARALQRLVTSPLLIHRSQVISISATELVVDDLVAPSPTAATATVAMARAAAAQLPSVAEPLSS